MPTLTQLEYALAVEKHRHFGKAAEACHISQPTLSQQLSKLEDELGVIIFDRIQKPVIPTDAGSRILEQARAVIRENERLLHLVKKGGKGVYGDFRLGMIPTVASHLAPLFVGTFSKAYPDVELFIEELKTETILTELKNDRLDGAILATPLQESGLKEHPLYYESFYLYLSEKHPLLKKANLTADDLDATQMWLLKDGHCFRTQIINFCSIPREQDAAFRNIHFQSGSLDTLRTLVRSNQGYTMIPALMVASMGADEVRRHVRPFRNPVPAREISFVYRRDHWKLDVIEAIEKSVRQSVPKELSLKRESGQKVMGIT